MRRIASITVLLAAAATAWGDAAEQAKKDFDELYGEQIRASKKTVTSDDDLKLARQIIEPAKSASVSPELMTLLCDAVCDLAVGIPTGQDLAAEAAALLAKAVPDKASYARRKLLDVTLKRYTASAGEARQDAGADAIEILQSLSEEETRAGDAPAATADLKAAERRQVPLPRRRRDAADEHPPGRRRAGRTGGRPEPRIGAVVRRPVGEGLPRGPAQRPRRAVQTSQAGINCQIH